MCMSVISCLLLCLISLHPSMSLSPLCLLCHVYICLWLYAFCVINIYSKQTASSSIIHLYANVSMYLISRASLCISFVCGLFTPIYTTHHHTYCTTTLLLFSCTHTSHLSSSLCYTHYVWRRRLEHCLLLLFVLFAFVSVYCVTLVLPCLLFFVT